MAEEIKLIVANPAGNTTILVLSPVPVTSYQVVTDKLLDIDFKAVFPDAFSEDIFREDIYKEKIMAEQVGFCLEEPRDGVPAMNMSGLEFCGNASRAFSYYLATNSKPPLTEVQISVSGWDYPLTAKVDPSNKDAKVLMPLPKTGAVMSAEDLGIADRYPNMADGILVDMDGIFHLVLKDVKPSREIFEEIKSIFYPKDQTGSGDHLKNFPAFGVMFIDTKSETMTPVVYVHEVDTTYFEGSCASGTTAAAFAEAQRLPDGAHRLTFREPAGTLYTEVKKESGSVTEIWLNGLIELSDVITVEI